MILQDSIEISAPPAAVFAFFDGMDNARYLGWHPDHRLFRWTGGQGLRVGNTFYFEEVIAGQLLKKHVVFTRIDEGSHIEFAPTFWLMRLFLPRLVFRLQPLQGGRWLFLAEIVLRMGPLAARLHRRELAAVREHMRIEGLNLKRFVEQRQEATTAAAATPDAPTAPTEPCEPAPRAAPSVRR